MKKITFLSLFTCISYFTSAQVINEPAAWPNTNWTLSGTYNAGALLGNPTTIDDSFTFDDDAAGISSDDTVEVESPVIDLTAAATASENLLLFDGSYNHRDIGGTLDLEYWDADSATWNAIFDFAGNGGGFDYQSCSNLSSFQTGLDISSFTATQLSGFKYRIAYDDNGGWLWGFCIKDIVLTSNMPSPPNCDSVLTSPTNGTVDVDEDDNLNWSEASGFPTGYKVSMGTTPGGTDVADMVDVGNVFTYEPGTLAFETTYYVTIIPYNAVGDATSCSEESFTTRADPNVIVDCDAGPVNTTYCYANSDPNQFMFTSSSSFPLTIVFNAGQTEVNFDELIILDSDGTTNLNAATPYGLAGDGDLTGITYTSTGTTLTVFMQSDGSVSCQTNGFTPLDFDVYCQTCTQQTVDFEVVGDCDLNEFTIDVNITDLGTATSITVSDDQGSADQTTAATGVVTFGPYAPDTDVVITVANADDANCVITSNPITFICPPPPNECSIIYAGADITVDCETPTTDLTASFMATGINPDVYDINALPTCPLPAISGGTPTSLDIDDRWSDIIDIGFEFCFFGDVYDQILIGSNGVLSFELENAGEGNGWSMGAGDLLPNGTNSTFSEANIFGAGHDIDPSVTGDINYLILGSAPNRQFVVNYTDVAHFSSACNTSVFSTTQIILYESSNVIDVNIIDKPVCDSWNGGLAVIGVQNIDSTIGFAPPERNTGVWTATDESWRFTPGGDPNYTFEWFDDDMSSLGSSETITVTPTATSNYTASVSYTQCDGSIATVTDQVTVNVSLSDANTAQPENLEGCATGSTGLGIYNLSSQDDIILNGLTGFSVTYHETQMDANNNINSISTPESYTSISNPQTIYARVEEDGTACFKVITFDLIPISCVFPQGISPNNDGFNDSFDLTSFDVSKIDIFNRNGILVYSKSNYTNQWIGQSDNGDELPVGTYFYVVRYQDGKEKSAWVYLNK